MEWNVNEVDSKDLRSGFVLQEHWYQQLQHFKTCNWDVTNKHFMHKLETLIFFESGRLSSEICLHSVFFPLHFFFNSCDE
jgi:hypothetical protein